MREAWPRLTNIHYVGPVPAALEASSAARTVFDNIVVMRIDQQTGKLTPTGQSVEIGMPVCIVMIPIK